MKMNEIQEDTKFKQTLTDFLLSSGIITSPELAFQYDPCLLYQLVCRRGGYHAVVNRKQWSQISRQFDEEPSKVQKFYRRYIFPFELKNYFGEESHECDPDMVLSFPRKFIKTEGGAQSQKGKSQEYTSLANQISKSLEEQQQIRKQFYLKKSKLSTSKAEIKKIILGLDAFAGRNDVVYSLNMLTLFSVNSHHPFLFQNYQKIFVALSNYTHQIYPPKNQQQMEDLRTITLIFRNLTMNPLNLKFMLGSPIFQLFVNMFNIGFDSQCSKNIVDIMNGLVKVGWDCQAILLDINKAILDDKIEDVEASVQLLRGLIDERDENLAPSVTKHIKSLLRVLMSVEVPLETKEQVFEILVFVTDISSQTRQELLKNKTLVSIIIGVLQQMKNNQKLVQTAALTLSNMSSSSTAKLYLRQYESQLMTIGFSDDSLAGIISNIMAQLSH